MGNLKSNLKEVIRNNLVLSKINDGRIKWETTKKNNIFSLLNRKETFEYIYKNNMWGDKKKEKEFYSGEGSHNEVYIESYCSFIKQFIREHSIKTVCDLGCGDYYVASRWIENNYKYIGIDIVSQIVAHHNLNYGTSKRKFSCLDIVEDELPPAELCIIRQVLQHLSNKEIEEVLKKTKQYKFVLITEHITRKENAQLFKDRKSVV